MYTFSLFLYYTDLDLLRFIMLLPVLLKMLIILINTKLKNLCVLFVESI